MAPTIDAVGVSSVRVVCRVRPPCEAACVADAVSVVGNTVEVVSDNRGTVSSFQFDGVLGAASSQKDVYAVAAQDLIEGVLDGYDGALLCYGQTGGGKTYTLEGTLDESSNGGILPLAARHIFEASRELSGVNITVSFVEIYLEKIQDLLANRRSSRPDSQNLGIRELDDRGPRVQGCCEVEVSSPKELIRLARMGAANRHVASTRMNSRSSRSHSIFSVTISHIDPQDGRIFSGTLHLVDLAGSERQLQSHAEGCRLNEARTINRSLSTLGNVIVALASANDEEKEALGHIPYRNSKLTWLLREALGGSSRAVLVLAVSPAMVDRRETLSSLRFGSRAMRVDNVPVARIAQRPQVPSRAAAEVCHTKCVDLACSLGHSASTTSTATASTTSLGACSGVSFGAAEQVRDLCEQYEHDKEHLAAALAQAFGVIGGGNFDARSFADRFLAVREQVVARNEQLMRSPPYPMRWAPLTPHRPRKWHAAIAWDCSPGGEPKLRAQLFEACGSDDSEHRLMMEMSAEEFSALPLSPWGRW